MICNKLILGTVQFGLNYGINNAKGKPTDSEVKKILDLAYKNGIRYLDTAEAYGNAQERIGSYHEGSLNKFNVITKFSSSIDSLSNDIERRIIENIDILKIDSLYWYMFHSFNDFKLFFKEFREGLVLLKKNKKIKKIGVSVYTNKELESVLEYDDIDLIQLPFNLFDNHKLRSEVVLKARKKGIEIHTRSVFLQGLFFKNHKELKGNLKYLKSPLQELHNVSSNYNINDLAINYVYNKKYIDKVLIGVDNADQLKLNIDSLNKTIGEKVFLKIESIKIKYKELLNPSNWKT